MERRTFLKLLALSAPAMYLGQIPVARSASNVITLIKKLNINLSTPGRIGFYCDYSELDTTGDHTFYVFRTHGTQGRVTVDFATYGDSHSNASGTLSWENGEADVKSFTAEVTSKGAGDHRIYAQLTNATGGAVLHNGAKTIAYGVIDDGSIAADNDAVFADFDAPTNGSGTQAQPYNNPYDAIANVGSKRYIYMKGTHLLDGTNTNSIGGTFYCLAPPATRTSEETRVYIRNWPGSSCTIHGTGRNNCMGVYTKSGESYQTFRGINFLNLDVTGVGGYNNGAGIFYHYGGSTDINLEFVVIDEVTGTTNNACYSPYGLDHSKVWRCSFDNTTVHSGPVVQRTQGVEYYKSTNISVQRCKITGCGWGIYPKGMDANTVCARSAFNIVDNCDVGIAFGYNSANGYPDFIQIHNNLIRNCKTYYGIFLYGAAPNQNGKIAIFNNVFDNCGGSGNGAIYNRDSYDLQMFNNIYYNCEVTWDMKEAVSSQSNTSRNQIEFADHEHEYGTRSYRYRYLNISYSTASSLNNVDSSLGANDTSGNPLFSNPVIDDYTLRAGSPCIGNGLGGVNQGIYLTGVEKLGPDVVSDLTRPDAPTGLTAT